jgi:signal peptidase I
MTRRIVRTVSWAVFLVGIAVVAVAVVVPRVAGATPYTVLTGSMQPDLPPGTLVVTRPVAQEDLAIGDVVTYQLRSGEPTVVTHRVVGIGVDGAGDVVYRTQGDANDVSDPLPVRPEQIRGELWYAVPVVGRLGMLLDSDVRRLLVPVVGVGLLAYAGLRLLGEVRRPRRRHVRGSHVAAPR